MKGKVENNKFNKIFKSKFFIDIFKYSLLFSIAMGFIIYIFLKYRKGFIWATDGLQQHFITLKYFRDLIKELISTGRFSTFIWNIGNGIDMFGNLSYYILGDPFSYLSILSPEKYLYIFYYVMIVIRIYFIGISFLFFCKYKKIEKGNIIGCIMYTFCSYTLFAGVRHPYFMNALILFPLLMIGIEKIILEDKKIFYTIIIALTTISNFYFAYSMFLIIAIYGTILLIYNYKDKGIKFIIKKALQILLYTLIGISISACILLPTIYGFLNCARSGNMRIYPYSINYYRGFLESLITVKGDNWSFIGVHPIILIVIPLFIKSRKDKDKFPIFLLLICLMVPLMISQIGSVLEGFSYPNNRWSFVIAFLLSYITSIFINSSSSIEKKDIKYIGIFSIIYLFLIYIARRSISLSFQINIIICIVTLFIIVDRNELEGKLKKINLYNFSLTAIIIIGIIYASYYYYDVEQRNYVKEFVSANSVDYIYSTMKSEKEDFNNVLKFIKNKDNSFYEIEIENNALQNVSIMKDYNSMSYYYSIIPNKLNEISSDLQNSQRSSNKEICEFDSRTKITTLLGNKYYIGKKTIPYGYDKIEEYKGETNIYENKYFLPFAVLYTNHITNDEYNKLNALEKESSLLKTVVLENRYNVKHNNSVIDYIKEKSTKDVEYKIKDNKILQNNKITIKDIKNNKIVLNIGEITNSELYVYIDNIQYKPYSKKELIDLEITKLSNKNNKLTDKQKIKNKYRWYQENYSFSVKAKIGNITKTERTNDYKTSPYYFDNSEYLINMGYYDKVSGDITLEFSKIGNYTFDSIKIVAVPMDDYENDINELRKSNFEVEDYGNGFLNATADIEENGILQFSTMYDKAWKVYVDGKKVDTFTANKYFLGIYIEKGKHNINMEYHTPYMIEGIIISIVGIAGFIASIKLEKIRKTKKQK